MKPYIYIILVIGLFVISCADDTMTPPVPSSVSGSIIVESEPAGAQIILDNNNTNKVTHDTLKNVNMGSHTIILKLDGYLDDTLKVSISSDVPTAKVHRVLTALGIIHVRSNPIGAQIYLDNNNTGKTTDHDFFNVAYGSHSITLKLSGYKDTTTTRNISPSQRIANITITLTPAQSTTVFKSIKFYEITKTKLNQTGSFINRKKNKQ